MHYEFGVFLRDLGNDKEPLPDAILAATDANCAGYVDRKAILEKVARRFPPSVVGSKAANGGQVKTGQRMWPGTWFFYPIFS
jgi:hypothetical protein